MKEDPTGSGTQVRIQVNCSQGGEIVYGEAKNAIDAKTNGVLLGGGSSPWLNDPIKASQSADCVATLYQWLYHGPQTFNGFATTSFTAAGK